MRIQAGVPSPALVTGAAADDVSEVPHQHAADEEASSGDEGDRYRIGRRQEGHTPGRDGDQKGEPDSDHEHRQATLCVIDRSDHLTPSTGRRGQVPGTSSAFAARSGRHSTGVVSHETPIDRVGFDEVVQVGVQQVVGLLEGAGEGLERRGPTVGMVGKRTEGGAIEGFHHVAEEGLR